jgi:predicted amidophosphoribosyltransferase
MDPEQRKYQLEGLFTVDPAITRDKKILLFDDLFRSGSTMNAGTDVLYRVGTAANVCALTLTYTTSRL